jgi:hypothetical protein
MRFEQLSGGDIITGQEPSVTVRYRAVDIGFTVIDAFNLVASFAMANVPLTYLHPQGLLFRGDMQLHENVYARSYDITVPYTKSKKESGTYQITVDQTGGTVNVKAGTRIAAFFNAAADEVNNGGLIGVNGDDVEGVDIPVESTKIVVNFRHPQGVLNRAYVYRTGALTGYVNSDPFLGREPGEFRYQGGNFTESDTEASAAYNFEFSENIVGATIGGIANINKKGWDVFSPTFFDDVENNNPAKKLKCLEVVRPAGREFKAFAAAFGWGG